jgi:hypothetical protein
MAGSGVVRSWAGHRDRTGRGTFKLSTDPNFEAKVADVVGLYLDPRVALWCCRSTRRPRCRPWTGRSRCCRSISYVRHGTTNLFAALDTGTGGVLDECSTSADAPRKPDPGSESQLARSASASRAMGPLRLPRPFKLRLT